jgi:hypothetical protein
VLAPVGLRNPRDTGEGLAKEVLNQKCGNAISSTKDEDKDKKPETGGKLT